MYILSLTVNQIAQTVWGSGSRTLTSIVQSGVSPINISPVIAAGGQYVITYSNAYEFNITFGYQTAPSTGHCRVLLGGITGYTATVIDTPAASSVDRTWHWPGPLDPTFNNLDATNTLPMFAIGWAWA